MCGKIVGFQSTLPLRGATKIYNDTLRMLSISIHAPLAGSDIYRRPDQRGHPYFNPRSPCGERPGSFVAGQQHQDFNPRSPCGERRASGQSSFPVIRNFNPRSPCGERLGGNHFHHGSIGISIHAPLAGSDGLRPGLSFAPWYFNPRSPCGERLSPPLYHDN